jgi:hypothetical protein
MEKTWKNVFFGGGTDMAVFCPNKRQDGMDIACRPVFCQPLHGQVKGFKRS